MAKIKKAVIPAAGLGTRFLPLSKVLAKELLPLVDKPILQYIIDEAIDAGVKEIIFVISPGKKVILDYLKRSPQLERSLKMLCKDDCLKELRKLEEKYKNISFSYVYQKKPLGDGHAVLLTEKLVGDEPCFILYPDDVVESKINCLKQLSKVFEKYRQTVMALCRVPKENLHYYGIIRGKKIAKRIFKIDGMVEKPSAEETLSLSNLAIVGKRIITPEVFYYLKKASPSRRGEIGLTDTLIEMIEDKKEVYGYEIDGKWLECGNKLAYLKSNLYLSLKHPQFGKELKIFLEKIYSKRTSL